MRKLRLREIFCSRSELGAGGPKEQRGVGHMPQPKLKASSLRDSDKMLGECLGRESLQLELWASLILGLGCPSLTPPWPQTPRSSQDLEWTLTAGACFHLSQCRHSIWSGGVRAFERKRQRKKRDRVCRAKPPEPSVNLFTSGFPVASDLDCQTQEVLGRQLQVCDYWVSN